VPKHANLSDTRAWNFHHVCVYDSEVMNTLVISINWEYFLGVVGTLIGIAYYANGRFTRLETSVEWLTETFRGLKIASENSTAKLFETRSPIALTQAGEHILSQSGLKSYIDARRKRLTSKCRSRRILDRYQAQVSASRLFAKLKLEQSFEHHLNEFAFSHGLSQDLLREVGAVYLRDVISQEINH
jgi:hypothetical protein